MGLARSAGSVWHVADQRQSSAESPLTLSSLLHWLFFCIVLAYAAHGASAQVSAATVPSAATFFRHPDIHAVRLSPDGERIAAVVSADGRRDGLYVAPVADLKRIRAVALFDDIDVRDFQWVNNERLVFDTIDRRRGSGDQEYGSGLHSVRADGEELRQLVQLRSGLVRVNPRPGAEPLAANHILLHVPATGGNEVIVGRIESDAAGDFLALTPLRLNVETGRARQAVSARPGDTWHWLFDREGEPRVAVSQTGERTQMHVRKPGAEEWDLALEGSFHSLPAIPAMLDGQGRIYMARSTREGSGELVRWDSATRAMERDAVVTVPGFDFRGSLVLDPVSGALLGVRLETDAETTVWIDESLKQLQAAVDQRLPGRVNRLECRRCTAPDRVVLVHSFSPAEPGRWFVLRGQAPTWTEVGRARKDIEPRQAATVAFHRIRARDGRDLPVWLTVPPGRAAGKGGPAVVLVHGGPWVRGGHWEWSAWEQFLASRGYVVINPEFRGSTGYGSAHFRAGTRQWGRAMQDDVADAVAWAVREGWADAKRVCIAGASYGGYAVLMGLVRHPELYRCGAAWVAVTDPLQMFERSWRSDVPDDARKYGYGALIGDPVRDADMLREVSPQRLADRLHTPLLLAFSREDRRVSVEHGERMREALRMQGRNPEYVVYDGEGHTWLQLQTYIDFAQRLERFLARHLAQ